MLCDREPDREQEVMELVEKHIQQADDTEGAFLIIDIDDFVCFLVPVIAVPEAVFTGAGVSAG